MKSCVIEYFEEKMWETKYVLSSRSIKKFSLRFHNSGEILRPNHMTIGHTCTKVKVLIQSQYTKLKVQLQIPNQYIQCILNYKGEDLFSIVR